MKKFSFVVVLMGLLSTNTYAQYYVNIGGGAVFPTKNSSSIADSSSIIYSPTSIGTSVFNLPGVNWQNEYKNGWNLNAGVGTTLGEHWRTELEFLYQHFNRVTSGNYGWEERHLNGTLYSQAFDNFMTPMSRRTNLYSSLINSYYNFNSWRKIIPMLGLGVGIAWINSPTTTADAILDVDDPSTPLKETAPIVQRSPSLSGAAFAGQFKAGIGYDWSQVTTILQYRLFATTKFKANQCSFTTNSGVPALEATFYVPQQNVSGIITNTIEVIFQFKL